MSTKKFGKQIQQNLFEKNKDRREIEIMEVFYKMVVGGTTKTPTTFLNKPIKQWNH